MIRSLIGGMPPYMRLRYLGFVRMMKYCDVLAVVHEAILPTVADLVAVAAPHLSAPLMVYPRIGRLSTIQQNRLAELPVGFTMTGTQTRYRLRILRELIKAFKRAGWYAPVYKHVPFEIPVTTASFANNTPARDSVHPDAPDFPPYLRAQYIAASPEYLFNLKPNANPPGCLAWTDSGIDQEIQ
jgi:hypothetical protein